MHEFHVWQLMVDDVIVTGHLVLRNVDSDRVELAMKQAKELLKKSGASRVTLQFEFAKDSSLPYDLPESCLTGCPNESSECGQKKCCIVDKGESEREPNGNDVEHGHGHGHGHSHAHGHGHSHTNHVEHANHLHEKPTTLGG